MSSATTSNAQAPAIGPAQSAFDERIVELSIILPDQTLTFQDLAIFASGEKFFSSLAASINVRIYNLTPQQRQQIITLSSPLRSPRTQVNIQLKVGRQSYGSFLLFTGQVILADVTQPPDIGIVFRGLANNFILGAIENVQYGANTPLAQVINGVGKSGGWSVNNQCKSKMINNFSYTGTPQDGVEAINQMGDIQACVDNGTLLVTDAGTPLTGQPYELNSSTGMVGIPQVTDRGVIVKMMINNTIQIGGSIILTSSTNPAANGTYKIMTINYEVANRDVPFWYTLVCTNIGIPGMGTQG
jgi:hypothetical protein